MLRKRPMADEAVLPLVGAEVSRRERCTNRLKDAVILLALLASAVLLREIVAQQRAVAPPSQSTSWRSAGRHSGESRFRWREKSLGWSRCSAHT